MKQTTLRLIVAAALIASFGSIGCSGKKKDTGKLEGTDWAAEPADSGMDTERIEKSPTTPALDTSAVDSMDGGTRSELADIYFHFDSYELRADQRTTLEQNARWLVANPAARVSIEGHCDERGTDEYNFALGDRRAKAAASYLRTSGVAESRIQTISYGEAYPADPGHGEAAWAKNRRAHFVIVGTR